MHNATFYFYAPSGHKVALKRVESILRSKLYATNLHWLETNSGQWSLVACKRVTSFTEILRLEKDFHFLAARYFCEYDGHEIEL